MRGERTIVCLMLGCAVVLAVTLFAATVEAQGLSIGVGVNSGRCGTSCGVGVTYQPARPQSCPTPAPVYREYVAEVVQPVVKVLPPRYEYSQPQCPPQPVCQPRCVPAAPAPTCCATAVAPRYYNGNNQPMYGGANYYPAQTRGYVDVRLANYGTYERGPSSGGMTPTQIVFGNPHRSGGGNQAGYGGNGQHMNPNQIVFGNQHRSGGGNQMGYGGGNGGQHRPPMQPMQNGNGGGHRMMSPTQIVFGR